MKREWSNQPIKKEFEEFKTYLLENLTDDKNVVVFVGDSSTAAVRKFDFDKVLALHKKQYYHHGYFQFIMEKGNYPNWYICSKKPIEVPKGFQRFYEDFDILDKSWEFMRKKV
jgi:hypothetical protein